jgi:hypothetical protein
MLFKSSTGYALQLSQAISSQPIVVGNPKDRIPARDVGSVSADAVVAAA